MLATTSIGISPVIYMTFDFKHLEGNELLFAALVFAVVLSAYMIGLEIWDRARRRGLACHWERDKVQPHSGTMRWVCMACGETGYSANRRAPLTCKKGLGASRL